MCSMPRILLACVTGASALHVVNDVMDEQRILLLGCSLDRNAVFGFCEHHGDHNMTYTTTRPLNSSWCRSSELNVRMSYVFHPGVGVNGDLDEPSFSNGPSTGQILKHFAKEASMVMLKAEPTLIVVDSSLWDLASWNVGPLHGHTESWVYTHTPIAKNVTKERVQQWCEHDLLTLLSEVSAIFNTSRIVFRTAPTILRDNFKFRKADIELLYNCINSIRTQDNKLFGKYDIIDYHEIIQKQIDRHVTGLFNFQDGYHPTGYPSELYINDILLHVGLKMPDPPEPKPDEGNKAEVKAKIEEDFGMGLQFKDPPEPQFDLDLI